MENTALNFDSEIAYINKIDLKYYKHKLDLAEAKLAQFGVYWFKDKYVFMVDD